jgi:uncharacterized protein YbcI
VTTGDGSDSAARVDAHVPGSMRLAISNAMVRLHKEYFGKGPTRARTYIDGDVVTSVLADVFTRAEQTLVAAGRGSSVVAQRAELQEAVREEFVGAVEEIPGRRVIAFFSGNQAEPEMSVEVFVLAPEESAERSSGE